MRFPLLALTLGACLAASAADRSTKIFPYQYDQYDLPNGLRVVTVPTDFPNIVALYIVVQTGSRNEVEPGKTGFAHLFEHMMFRGTKETPPDKYEAIIRTAGAASNAFTSDDLTTYHTTFAKEDLDQIMRIEADRFQHLDYSPDILKTESLAVLGEYNKNSSSPFQKMEETMRNTAFDKHTYKHTTMGFLEDVKNMPSLYDYSRQFFDRYYRPEYVTVLVVGDVNSKQVRPLVEKYWGSWKRGNFVPEIPAEPKQTAPRTAHVDWPAQTLPFIDVGYKGPAYSDTEKDAAALDIISDIGFSQTSDLYQRLVVQQQKVDMIRAGGADSRDPSLFEVMARVKKQSDINDVEEQILNTLNGFKDTLVPADKLEAVKKHNRYAFAMSLDNDDSIALTLAHFVALRRTPETINRYYSIYEKITPEDLRNAARKYFVDTGRTVVTLTGPAAAKTEVKN